jgi:RNA-binding protein NOB1
LDATAKLAVQLEGTSLESESTEISTENNETIEQETLEPLDVKPTRIGDEEPTNSYSEEENPSHTNSPTPIYDDPSDSDDGEGEWITPSNVAIHKSRALDLLPGNELVGKHTKRDQPIGSGCMTADFAMQNVLLQMGLNLVGLEGKRIEKVKNWVLRCHACFKYAKILLFGILADIPAFELEYARIIPKNFVLLVATQLSCVRQ